MPSHYLDQCCIIVNWKLGTNLREIFSTVYTFSFKKYIWKCRLQHGGIMFWPQCVSRYTCASFVQCANTARQNGRHFAEDIFKGISLNENFRILNKIFTEICSLGSIRQCGSIGLGNGLAQNRRHAIIWSNVGMLYWRIFASLGLSELRQPQFYSIQIHYNPTEDRVLDNFVFIGSQSQSRPY